MIGVKVQINVLNGSFKDQDLIPNQINSKITLRYIYGKHYLFL